tara:strand:+ start:183650 stop:184585 length:936 start_codon:yes stop_codon:yes gene_type:complete
MRYNAAVKNDHKKVSIHSVAQAIEYCNQALLGSDVCFGHGTDNAWDEAVQMVLGVMRLPVDSGGDVLAQVMQHDQVNALQALLQRRIKEHIPLPYLLGQAWFAGLPFRCDERAIVPRSPIAELIENDFTPWYNGPPFQRVLDLCCGGGCIGLAAAYYHPAIAVDLLDIDPAALRLGVENATDLGLAGRVRFMQSDLWQAVAGQRYDLILSNPPYVDAADLADMPDEYRHEPEIALGSGRDGLSLARRILAGAEQHLTENGLLVLEVGNSWASLEQVYPRVPFTWIEFERGGHGVLAITAQELREYSASLRP